MKKNPKDRTKKHNNKRKLTPEKMVIRLFVFALVFYCATKIGLNSYNITLSVQEQALTRTMNQTQQEVDQLNTDINNLQEKSRVLGMLDDDVADNQKNVYIID